MYNILSIYIFYSEAKQINEQPSGNKFGTNKQQQLFQEYFKGTSNIYHYYR